MHCGSCPLLVLAAVTSAAPAQIIGVDVNSSGISPTNWNTLPSSVGSLTNLVNESGTPTGVNFTFLPAGQHANSTPAATTIPQHTQSLAGLNDTRTGPDPISAIFSNLTPGASYNVWFFGLKNAPMYNIVTIAGGGAPITFSQNANSPQELWVNGQIGSSANTLASYALVQTADSAGTISIMIDDDPTQSFLWWGAAGMAIQPVPAPATLVLGVALGAITRRRR